MYENVNFYATDHPMNLAEDTYDRLAEAEHYARDERENPEAYLPFADGENGPHWSDIPFEEPPLFRFGQIIRPRSRFMDQLGTVWSCHEKNAHSVTFYRCSDSAGELEPVPTMALPYKGMTDGEVMEANGLQPLLIPEEMLICDCQFGVADPSFTCYECYDLGLIHYQSFLGGVLKPTWRHLLGPQTTPESIEQALIHTIAVDLYWADYYAKIQGTLSQDDYLTKAQIEWERMRMPEEERLLHYNQSMQWESNMQAMCI